MASTDYIVCPSVHPLLQKITVIFFECIHFTATLETLIQRQWIYCAGHLNFLLNYLNIQHKQKMKIYSFRCGNISITNHILPLLNCNQCDFKKNTKTLIHAYIDIQLKWFHDNCERRYGRTDGQVNGRRRDKVIYRSVNSLHKTCFWAQVRDERGGGFVHICKGCGERER